MSRIAAVSAIESPHTKALFYNLAVFLKKWAQIKNDIPTRIKDINKWKKKPAKEHYTKNKGVN